MAAYATLFFVVVALALAVIVLRAISIRLPMLGIVAGLALCLVPLPMLLSLRDLSFRSDGSAAGAFVPIIVGFLVVMAALVAVGLGVQTLQVSWKNLRGEPADWGNLNPNAGNADEEHVARSGNSSKRPTPSQPLPRENRYAGIFCLAVALLSGGLGIGKMFFGAQYACMRTPCDFSYAIYARFGSVGVGVFELIFGLCAAGAAFLLFKNDSKQKSAPASEIEPAPAPPPGPAPQDVLYGIDKALLGMCSNCRRVTKLSNAACPHCHASPNTDPAWHIEPLLKGEMP